MKIFHFKWSWKKILMDVGFVILVVVAVRTYQQWGVEKQQIPHLLVKDLSGQTFYLDQADTKPYVIHLWATWCPICQTELGTIESLAQDYLVLKIAQKSGFNHKVLAFAQKNDLKLPGLVNDPQGLVGKALKTRAVPVTYFVMPGGAIATQEVGWTSEWGMRLRLWWLSLGYNSSVQ